jgi:hypothetical protein
MTLQAKTVVVWGADFVHNYGADEQEFFRIHYLPAGALAVRRHQRHKVESMFSASNSDEIEATVYAPGEWLRVRGDA